ncbi:MAG: SgcJ/EcaC family oxidoreductase [Bryobacteraceae bacterium]
MTIHNTFVGAVTLTLLLTFMGCQTAPQAEPKRDVTADMKAINALRDQVMTAFNSGDAAALAATYADDAVMMNPNQPAVEGRQAIQASYETMFKEGHASIAFTPLETQVTGDWAYDRGNYSFTLTPKSGKPTEESAKYLVICKRQPDGSWKLHREMSNSNNPPRSPAGKKK